MTEPMLHDGGVAALCVLCEWAVTYDWFTPRSDIEEAIRDHLNAEHPGWTMEQLRAAVVRQPHVDGGS